MRIARMQQLMLAAQLAGAVLAASGVLQWTELGAAWAALAAVVTPIGAHGIVIGSHFVAAGRARRRLDPDAPAWRAGETLRAFAGELYASIAVFAIAQPLLSGYPIRQPARASRIPVVLVHGYFCNRGIWRSFARELAQNGHPVEAVNLEPAFGSIDAYTEIIDRAVETLRSRTGAPRVALVCHSMGGLAARAYARRHDHAAIALLVTIATPHHGTWHAHRGPGLNARQMEPDSAWLRALAEHEDEALRARTLCVYTEHDNIVAPQSSARLEGTREFGYRALGHVELLRNRAVLDRLRSELAALDSEVDAAH